MNFGGLLVVLIVWGVVSFVKKTGKKWVTPSGTTLEEQLKKRDERMARRENAPPSPSYIPAERRAAPTGHMPDAPCIVCENTGENHFVRDKARRIAQLDDFLKNGIIDKAEYRRLLDRYERGI